MKRYDQSDDSLMMSMPRIGTSIIEARRVALHNLVVVRRGWPPPAARRSSPVMPVLGCKVRSLVNCRPSLRTTSSHWSRSKAAAIVAVRNKPVSPERALRVKIVLLLDVERSRMRDATVVSDA
jgi:hypothetical protein